MGDPVDQRVDARLLARAAGHWTRAGGRGTLLDLHLVVGRPEPGGEGGDTAPQGKLDRFTREIAVEGDLDEDQRPSRRAERCPVHRTLQGNPEVVTRLADVPTPHRGPNPVAADGASA
jgi:hypothetical protein